jgi:hypothetical protein
VYRTRGLSFFHVITKSKGKNVLKKTIEYLDFDDNLLKEDFYFNLTTAEIAEMELSYENGLTHHLKRIIATKDGAQIIATFKHIIAKAYGVRSDDGKRFIKTPDLWAEFSQTNAYSVLFIELVTDAAASSAFIVGIVPKDVAKKIADAEEKTAKQDDPFVEAVDKSFTDAIDKIDSTLEKREIEEKPKTVVEYTLKELMEMPNEEFSKLDPRKLSKTQLETVFRRRFNIA